MAKKKLILKVICAAIAILMMFFLFVILNGFVGNPISSTIAKNKIESYVKENYDISDLELGKIWYNFKDGKYQMRVKSKTSIDTHFAIAYGRNKIYDTYEFDVANKTNTYSRLSDEMRNYVKKIISKEYPYKIDLLNMDVGLTVAGNASLDMPLDVHNPPASVAMTIWIICDNPSKELTQKSLVELHQLMKKYNIQITTYTISLRKPNMTDEDFKHSDNWGLSYITVKEVEEMVG